MDIQEKTIIELGEQVLVRPENGHRILCLSVIGEIEGHEDLPDKTKTTKYSTTSTKKKHTLLNL